MKNNHKENWRSPKERSRLKDNNNIVIAADEDKNQVKEEEYEPVQRKKKVKTGYTKT